MKKTAISALLTLFMVCANAQDYTITTAGIVTEITFYTPQIVRVTKYQSSDALGKSDPKVVVTMTPQEVKPTLLQGNSVDTLKTEEMMVTCNRTTGVVGFYRPDGTTLLKERGRASFTKRTSHAIDPYDVSQSFRLSNGEAIYGFGQVQDGNLNHRNKSYNHMVQNNMSVWIPFFHSTRGYGLYWDLYGPCDFSDNTSNGATFKTEAAHAVDYYILVGSETDGDDVVRRVRELTGQATMVPLWTFGYFQSKERYQSATETLGVLQKYRSIKVPIDCVVQDWQYWGDNNQWNAMEFLNPQFRTDYPKMIDGVHNDGGHILISVWANFGPDTKQYAHFKTNNQLMKMGSSIMTTTYPPNSGVAIYSPYQQSARDYYWKCLYEGLVNKGVDAYWVDSSEPDHYQGGEDWERTNDFIVLDKDDKDNATLNPHSLETTHTWRSMRNVFPLMHASGVYDGHRKQKADLTEAKRVMIMTRSGFVGMQRYGAGTWSGDITSSWETLANQIPAALNYSACGIPSWNSDIGGFFNGSYHGPGQDNYNELYCRWIQFGAFCTIMRSHGSGTDRAIYQFGKKGESYFDIIARYINLRYALLPYIYSTDRQVYHDGYSFMRAMGIAYPADSKTHELKDQFMFGRDILVAPVVKSQAEQRKVYLPVGDNWTDIWTGLQYEGGQTVNRSVSLALMPLFVRQGSIIPWGPDVQYSSQSDWKDLEVRVYPGANGAFTLYEDERDNYNYEQGQFSEIPFSWNDATHTLTIGARKGEFNGMQTDRTFRIVLVDPTNSLGLGIKQSVRFSKEVTYSGSEVSVQIDNEHLVAEDIPAVQSIQVSPSNLKLYLGQSQTISIKATLEDGTSQFVTLDAVCESSDNEIAYIRDGIIYSGMKEGRADINITYTDGLGKDHHAIVTVETSIPSNLYTWKAVEWYRNRVADRLGSSDITYSSKDNTITITKKGAQNIALKYSEKRYMEPGMKYLVAVASDISKDKGDSQLWYINGTWVNIVNPTEVKTLDDGRVMVAWAIDENKGYELTGETIFGMTSTSNTGRSVISYVGFSSDLKKTERELKDAVSIHTPSIDPGKPKNVYSIDGVTRPALAHGINIVVDNNGKTSKVYKK
jgi:alpha-D-xyloside xylohydrolase